nr:MAG TPA: hypothetical protein [Caudoviricetes sp.]
MEIKLNAGDRINIPENCKATIEDNVIIIEEQEEFKDGDILRAKKTDKIAIFKEYGDSSKDSFCSHYSSYGDNSPSWVACCFRHATEEEKQAFFDELKTKGLRWNAETKTMERIRGRVKYGGLYLNVSTSCEVIEARECYDSVDNKRWEVGNYYQLSERAQAEEDAKAVRAIYEKRLKVK